MLSTELNFHVDIVKCKRLGRPVPWKSSLCWRPVLPSVDEADEVMRNAKRLRNSNDIVVRQNIYINRHLTAAQSRAAYDLPVNYVSLLSNVLHVHSHHNHCRQHHHQQQQQQQQQRSRIWPTMCKCHCHYLMLKVSCLTTCFAWSLNRVQPLISLLLLVLHQHWLVSLHCILQLTNHRLWGRFASYCWIFIIKLLPN